MNGFLVLWRKEVTSFVVSPVAYVAGVFFLVVMGFIFWFLASLLATGAIPGVSVMNLLFGSPFFWMTQLVIAPILTMRSFAEERRTGTFETLLTAPISDAAVVLAKYMAVLTIYILIWTPTVAYVYVLREFSALEAPVDLGAMAGGYIGALLIGMFYLAIGLFCSALTSNQIIAAISSFALILLLFFGGFLDVITHRPGLQTLAAILSSHEHMFEFSRGVIDTRPILFHLSGTALLLFATLRALQSRHWKT
ncbi:MAG TPA: ABC transporter permease [Kiritimatiellia bacterium]|nr:ABC transporter permease [Kiritimatiellia bacterium]